MTAETEAGRWLLANVKPTYTPPESGKSFAQHVVAIEDEARRATVEHITHEVLFYRNRTGKPSERIPVTAVLAILDEELTR